MSGGLRWTPERFEEAQKLIGERMGKIAMAVDSKPARNKVPKREKADTKRRSKYGAVRTEFNGRVYDSAKEAARAKVLQTLERIGEISQLREQVKFSLDVNGVHVANYVADFTYMRSTGEFVVEDVKSPPTRKRRDYRMKAALMQACHLITVLES